MDKDEIRRQEVKYYRYIKTHRDSVMAVWKDFCKLIEHHHEDYPDFDFSPIERIYKVKKDTYLRKWHHQKVIQDIDNLIAGHDNTKFSEPEFTAGRKYYFPTEDEKNEDWSREAKGASAIHHHYINNPHHYQQWNLGGIKFEIKFEYVIEMLCDWASSYYPDSPKKTPDISLEAYSYRKYPDEVFHPATILTIDKWLPIFEDLIEARKDKNERI
jgi:hypothetical protein